ncbi:MAG TPA: hypothetical protein VHS80_13645 [Chthoniobacterales bacterium]|jgi:hypothetical protein|nr:hypothetical protein [Chthoniobacterales bacterium]
MSRILVCFPFLAGFVALQACSSLSSRLSTQQVAAYSVATGFLTFCDFGDFKGALTLYANPIKSHPDGTTWATTTQAKRAPFGLPILRTWTNRRELSDSANMTFRFRTSFSAEPLVDEFVSVTRTSGQLYDWQVYEYKFHALGKHPAPSVTPKPAARARSPLPPPSSSVSPSPRPSPSEPPLPAVSP